MAAINRNCCADHNYRCIKCSNESHTRGILVKTNAVTATYIAFAVYNACVSFAVWHEVIR